jgi:hypothetical protein
MTFEEAVRATPGPVRDAYQPGKQALKSEHRDQVTCPQPRRFTGSIDLEAALLQDSATAPSNPWDYGIGFRERTGQEVAIWVEVHPASTAEVSTVLKKYGGLRDWLRDKAPALNALSQGSSLGVNFVWLATEAGVHIPPGSPQARKLRQAGLATPRRRLELK